jgi:glycosyltransferase involved in cell wall biosynthesis
MKLVAVTRILNEDDIVEAFVRHHATMVDHHLFLDNGSTDRTIEILRSLRAEGLNVAVLQNQVPFYTEVSYNSALFKQARAMYGADWVLFLDTDEFLDIRETPAGLPALFASLPSDARCLSVPSINYVDVPSDDPTELIVPRRMRSRWRVSPEPTVKIFARGDLADAGAVIEAGQHTVVLHGNVVTPYDRLPWHLAHYYRRSSWQEVSKVVLGRLKVLAAGRLETEKGRSSHYKELYRAARERPGSLFDNSFINQDRSGLDLVEDPLPYLGGPLRYTRAEDPGVKAMGVLLAYAEQLATQHGMLIDSNASIRAQTNQAALTWHQLI